MITLDAKGPCDCVTIREEAAGEGGLDAGTVLTQQIDAAAGLPAELTTSPGWRTAKLSALVYSGGALGNGAVVLVAEGHRGSCSGPVVSRFSAPATFKSGEVVSAQGTLLLLGRDQDGDGYAEGEDCNDQDPSVYPGAPELCDGKDHSCSGIADKGCPCTAGSVRGCYPTAQGLADPHLGKGICKAGAQSCEGGKWGAACAGAVLPEAERCDGKDHDCDGTIGLPSCPCQPGAARSCFTKGRPEQADVGRCKSGKQICDNGGFWGACAGEVGPLPFELCNGIDDNCDGHVDEMFDAAGKPVMVRPACPNQSGVCAGSQQICTGGQFVACAAANYEAAAEAKGTTYSTSSDAPKCDGIDHNCNGTINDGCDNSCGPGGSTRDCYGLGLTSPTIGKGICKKGTQTCAGGQWGACAGQQTPLPETCNGKDDDCNGAVDDLTQGEGAACSDTGLPGVCTAGVRRCVSSGGVASLQCAPVQQPSAEVCNGLDDNCDGRVDEGFDKQHDPLHCGGPNECFACSVGDLCCGGRCASTKSDPLNCGACGNACASGQGCCDGQCKDLTSSALSCGACGRTCAAGELCRAGQCGPATETNCANGVDDDHNGKTDCEDAACAGKVCDATGGVCKNNLCAHETNCADGIDNDGDGKIDCADSDCLGKRCAGNGICQADGRCVVEICTNKIDDNGDGKVDCEDALVCPAPANLGTPLCCSQSWVDGKNDVKHCGSCGNDCTAGHSAECGSIACVKGACVYGNATDRSACSGGLCCRGACTPDRETSCTDRIDNNCDGKIDCQDALGCPAPGGLTAAACCDLTWIDKDKDPLNCGGCGKVCPGGDQCHAPVCRGAACGLVTVCTNPGCDGQVCSAGGAPGVCGNGVCCAGCVAADGTCQAGTALHACVSAGSACADCSPSNNQCLDDACTGSGCTHTPAPGRACTSGGIAGKCTSAGICCTGCFDGNGACQAISVDRCGVPGGACLPSSCNDNNPCTADSCSGAGQCVHAPTDGAACSANGGGGVCTGSQCCTGCIDAGACQTGSTTASCGAAGALCQQCPPPSNFCKQASCATGSCGTTDKPDNTPCSLGDGGTGACKTGVCSDPTTCPTALCNGICCNSGESCQGSGGAAACVCDSTCATGGGCCSSDVTPSRCLVPSFDTCYRCSLRFCSSSGDTGKCIAKNACSSQCGFDVVACGGNECLVPDIAGNGPSGNLNICSTPANAQACGILGSCSCNANDPSSCPRGPTSVCRANFFTSGNSCAQCGDNLTSGLPCKNGLTCMSGVCQ